METMTINGRSFEVLRLLGHGKSGYSYLVRNESGLYVLKQIHHEPCDYYNFGDKFASELRDYARLRALGIRMPELLDSDRTTERLLKEFIEGETVYEQALEDRVPDEYFAQLRGMCRVLYANGLNIDYFPTNFIGRGGLLYYVDYECSGYMEQWDFEHWGIKYWSRTPELLEYTCR